MITGFSTFQHGLIGISVMVDFLSKTGIQYITLEFANECEILHCWVLPSKRPAMVIARAEILVKVARLKADLQ